MVDASRHTAPEDIGWQACFRALMLEVKAISRSAPNSPQGLKEKIMVQHVKLFNALSPSDKEGWDTTAADLSCEHARNIENLVQHTQCGRDQLSHIEDSSRPRGIWLDAACQHGSFGILRLGRTV